MNDEDYRNLFKGFKGEEGELIPILLKIQEGLGYVSEDAVKRTAQFLRISENQVYGVASFYSKFRFVEPGVTSIKVCMGTACHVHGGKFLSDAVGWRLGVSIGQVTPDHRFDFRRVNCLGCCALAPVIQVNGQVHGRMRVTGLEEILDNGD
jgi:NADH:ubiquinone oxidoreductase subunit E